jgi:transaldolase
MQDCALEMSVDIDDADREAIQNLQDISIICSKTTNPYLKVSKNGKFQVVACDELAGYIWKNSKQPVEQHGQPGEMTVS